MPRKEKLYMNTQTDWTETNVPEIEPSKMAKFDVIISKVICRSKVGYEPGFGRSGTGIHMFNNVGYLAYLIYRDRVNINPFVNYVIEHYPTVMCINSYLNKSIDIPTLDDKEWISLVIRLCKFLHSDGKDYCTRSMFWALLLLALDDTDNGERLSIACDFARMLGISDEEMLDLVNVVKYVLQDDTYEKPKLEHINKTFADVLNMYEQLRMKLF